VWSELYVNPPEQTLAVVLWVDENSQVQALELTQPLLPMRPGQAERKTHNYVRLGTTSLFAALDVATGKVIGQCHSQYRCQEFLRFLARIGVEVSSHMKVHLGLDNYATHKTPKVERWFKARPRHHLHCTLTSAPWLNQVERWFAKVTEQAITAYTEQNNHAPKPFVWTASADLILGKVQACCERINRSPH